MFKTRKLLKRDNEVLLKDNNAKAAKIAHLEEVLKKYSDMVKEAQGDALAAKAALAEQEHNNALLQEQMTGKSCEGCIHSANYQKCTSCARYPKLKDKFEHGKEGV